MKIVKILFFLALLGFMIAFSNDALAQELQCGPCEIGISGPDGIPDCKSCSFFGMFCDDNGQCTNDPGTANPTQTCGELWGKERCDLNRIGPGSCGCDASSGFDGPSLGTTTDCSGNRKGGCCLPTGTTKSQICQGAPVCTDADRDGFFSAADCGTDVDCDDNDGEINPGIGEVCDGLDNNCDGQTDEGFDRDSCTAACTQDLVKPAPVRQWLAQDWSSTSQQPDYTQFPKVRNRQEYSNAACCGDDALGDNFCTFGLPRADPNALPGQGCVAGQVVTDPDDPERGQFLCEACSGVDLGVNNPNNKDWTWISEGRDNQGPTPLPQPFCCGNDYNTATDTGENQCAGTFAACSNGTFVTDPDDSQYLCEQCSAGRSWGTPTGQCCGDDIVIDESSGLPTGGDCAAQWDDGICSNTFGTWQWFSSIASQGEIVYVPCAEKEYLAWHDADNSEKVWKEATGSCEVWTVNGPVEELGGGGVQYLDASGDSSGASLGSGNSGGDPDESGGGQFGPGRGNDDNAPNQVNGPFHFIDTNLNGYIESIHISSITQSGPDSFSISMDADTTNWPVALVDSRNGLQLVGNIWLCAWRNSRWVCGTFDWLTPGQTTFWDHNLGRDDRAIYGELSDFAAQPGELYGIIVTSAARDGYYNSDTIKEKSNIFEFRWPGGSPTGSVVGIDSITGAATGNSVNNPPPIDTASFSNVVWIDRDVSDWTQTVDDLSVSIGNNIRLDHRGGTNDWPIVDGAVGNAWIFVYRNNKWHAGTWEWLTRGQKSKFKENLENPSVIGKLHSNKELINFVAQPGERYGFMISGTARSGLINVQERSNIVMATWTGSSNGGGQSGSVFSGGLSNGHGGSGATTGASSQGWYECAPANGHVNAPATGGTNVNQNDPNGMVACGEQTFYCTSRGWMTDLDFEKEACQAFLNPQTEENNVWTGNYCCGDLDDFPEYYNDLGNEEESVGGCWASVPVLDDNFVLSNQKIIYNETRNQEGQFISCAIDSNQFDREGQNHNKPFNPDNDELLELDDCPNPGAGECDQEKNDLINDLPYCSFASDNAYFCSYTEVWQQSLGRNRSELKYIEWSEIVDWESTDIIEAQCCETDKCWNGTSCVGSQTDDPRSVPYRNTSLRCIDGEWEHTDQKPTWDKSEWGFCPENDQCLVNPFSINKNPDLSLLNRVDIFNPFGNDVQCINSGDFIGDNYCDNGNWTSRTKLVALQLLDVAQNSIEPDNYVLYCDSFVSATNFFTYDIATISGIDKAFGYLINNCNYETSNLKTGDLVPCVNQICVLRYQGDTDEQEEVVFGAALNQLPETTPYSFLDLLALPNDYCNGISEGDQFSLCLGADAWFNKELQSMIYARDQVNLNAVSFYDKFVLFLQNPFQRIFNIIINVIQPRFPGGAKFDLDFIEETQDFSRLYLNKHNDKSIQGVMERVDGQQFFSVTYTGFSADICKSVDNYVQATNPRAVISCDFSQGSYFVETISPTRFNTWRDLTARTRVQ